MTEPQEEQNSGFSPNIPLCRRCDFKNKIPDYSPRTHILTTSKTNKIMLVNCNIECKKAWIFLEVNK